MKFKVRLDMQFFCIIFEIVNIEKIYFLKLCLDGLKNLKQN
jgi:hypothetical protein